MNTNYFERLKDRRRYCPCCGFVAHKEGLYWNRNLEHSRCNYIFCTLYSVNMDEDRVKTLHPRYNNYDYRTGELLKASVHSKRQDIWNSFLANMV